MDENYYSTGEAKFGWLHDPRCMDDEAADDATYHPPTKDCDPAIVAMIYDDVMIGGFEEVQLLVADLIELGSRLKRLPKP